MTTLSAVELRAQDRYLDIAARYSRPEMLHESIVLPDGDGSRVYIIFRIPNSILVFVQEQNRFVAEPEISAELYRDGRKVDEKLHRARISASSFDETQSRTHDLVGMLDFVVDDGVYTYRLSLNGESEASATESGSFRVAGLESRSAAGMLIFGSLKQDSQYVRIDPAAYGGDVPFGEGVTPLLLVDAPLEYQLYRLSRAGQTSKARRSRTSSGSDSRREQDFSELNENAVPVERGTMQLDDFVPVGKLQTSVGEEIILQNSGEIGFRLAALPIRTDRLEIGTYALRITSEGRQGERSYIFSTIWREMPYSLYDVGVAIRHLEYMESREAIRTMLRGSRDDQIDAFTAYWQERDPTPGTVLNELMFEYYRRIDQAAVDYRTGRHPFPDGLQTDAARIFIIHGAPDKITNTLPDSGGIEQTWIYPDGRRFVFWAANSMSALQLQEKSAP